MLVRRTNITRALSNHRTEMFYFFRKGDEYLRCELLPRDNGACELFIVEPGGQERVERFKTSNLAEQRWEELRIRFNVDGWAGPFGRE